MFRYSFLALAFLVLLGGAITVSAQEDPLVPNLRPPKEDTPRNFQEMLDRMRIEKEKKEFGEMLKRGEDVKKLADELNDTSTVNQHEKILEIGKLVKKIREELGGDGDEDADKDIKAPATTADGIRSLKEEVNGLSEELKKATRFTVSAAAIDRTNDILRLIKYLNG